MGNGRGTRTPALNISLSGSLEFLFSTLNCFSNTFSQPCPCCQTGRLESPPEARRFLGVTRVAAKADRRSPRLPENAALCGLISQRAGPNRSAVLVHTRAPAVMSAARMNEPPMPKMGVESRRAEPRADPSDPW